MIQRLLAFFTPPSLASDSPSWDQQRTHLLILAALVVVALSLPSIVLHYLTGAYLLGHFAVFSAFGAASVLAVLRWQESLRSAAWLLLGCLFSSLFASILLTGGIISPILPVLYAPALFGLVFLSRATMVMVMTAAIMIVISLMVLNEIGVEFPVLFHQHSRGVLHGFMAVVILLGVLAAFYFSDAIRLQAYALLEQERDSVQEKVRIATETLQEQQRAITRINTSLEAQNTELSHAIEEAERAKKLQSEFLRNVSHEVRTPLTAVLGFAEILHDRIPPDDPVSQEFAQQISLAGQNLMDIFSNILMLSSLESSHIEIAQEPVLLPLLLAEIHKTTLPHAAQKDLRFDCRWSPECEKPCLTDARYVREIIRHLLSNAIKFTEQGRVLLNCEIEHSSLGTQSSGRQLLRIIVHDTGIGIKEENRTTLFLPFYQYDGSKNRQYGGMGIGLAITKRLVDAMQGSIACESEPGNGATFVVELPTHAGISASIS